MHGTIGVLHAAGISVRIRSLFLIFIFAQLISGCTETMMSGQVTQNSVASELQGGFRPNESLEYYSTAKSYQRRGRIEDTGDYYNYSPAPRNIDIAPIEVPFSTDPGILLAPKRVKVIGGCNRDKVTDGTTCHLNIWPQGPLHDGGLFQIVDLSGNIKISCISGHDFPGRRGAIRVDSNTAFVTDTEGCIHGAAARRLQNQLVNGRQLITRYVEWPYDYAKDETMLISGSFRVAQELYLWSAKADMESLFSAR